MFLNFAKSFILGIKDPKKELIKGKGHMLMSVYKSSKDIHIIDFVYLAFSHPGGGYLTLYMGVPTKMF